MKRIAIVSNMVMHYRVLVYEYFAERFRADGYELVVLATELQADNPYDIRFDLRVIGRSFGAYRQELRALDPAAVIVFLHLKDVFFWPLVHWLKLMRIPAIFWTKGANLDDPGNRLRHLAFRYTHAVFDRLILYSPHEADYVAQRHRHKIAVANNTINHHRIPAVHDTPDAIRREFGIPFTDYAILVGRIGAGGGRKKADHAIEVFNRLDLPGKGLVIVGSGMTSELQNRVNRQNTLYLGALFDPEDRQTSRLMSAASFALIPGHVGLGLNQAFFWGLPVVTEEGLQPPEVHYLVDGRNGYIVQENDIDALVERVKTLFCNADLLRALSENARRDALENASIESMYEGFRTSVERALGSASRAKGARAE